MMHGTPYVMRRRILLAPSRPPCTPPPFGSSGGRRSEDRALVGRAAGIDSALLGPTELADKAPPDWGSLNLGGPIVTAGGLVFIGAALDRPLHAFDIETGRELWNGAAARERQSDADELPASHPGEQFVADRGRRRGRLGSRRSCRRLPACADEHGT